MKLNMACEAVLLCCYEVNRELQVPQQKPRNLLYFVQGSRGLLQFIICRARSDLEFETSIDKIGKKKAPKKLIYIQMIRMQTKQNDDKFCAFVYGFYLRIRGGTSWRDFYKFRTL